MLLVIAHADGSAFHATEDFSIDMAVGDDENDFELELPDSAPRVEAGSLVYSPGTDWGGVVDTVSATSGPSGSSRAYSGRTWTGVLASRVVLPPSGSGYFESHGEAHECIRALVAHLGLGGIFTVPMADSGFELDYRWDRFTDAWHGLVSCLKSSGARPRIRFSGGMVEVSAVAPYIFGAVPGERLDMSIRRDHRPVNHLVCAGSGELADRAVVHFYADEEGNVSHVQSLFGIDEVSALYDYTNASEDELEAEGAKKLADYQVEGTVEVTVPDGSRELDVGDTVTGTDSEMGVSASAEIVKKVLKVSLGVQSVDYECGQASSTKSLDSSSESSGSGGGHAYYAGEGLTLTGYTFSADVTSDDISRVEEDVSEAMEAASDAAAEAAHSVKGVSASGFITVSRESGQVTIGAETVTASEVNKWFS